jgi:hypothetical protein
MLVAINADQSVLDNLATVKAILSANFGPTPIAFLEGIQEQNQLVQAQEAENGNIYRGGSASTSDERSCPWCAETIKAAARICRFCGREL